VVTAASQPRRGGEPAAGDGPVRVLLIEDDEDDYLLTRDLLAEIGPGRYALEWVRSYAAGAEALARQAHDVCLLDYRLGAHHGLDLVRPPFVDGKPIILLTGQDDPDVDLRAMRAGAADYLVKGQIDARTLERAIRYALAHKHTEAMLRQLQTELESRVEQRTAQLARANDELRREMAERRRVEDARLESQRWLEAVVETAPSLIVVTDASGRITLFNRACEEVTGYGRDEALGRDLIELLVPPAWRDAVRTRFADPHAPALRAPHENPWRTRDGAERLIEWRCTALTDARGATSVVGVGVDVTERRRMEQELRRQAAALKVGDRRKDEFLAMLGHELRNPLAPVYNALQILKTPAAGPDACARARES
jgi:two-component system, LuxR family, sensor kinase FixL